MTVWNNNALSRDQIREKKREALVMQAALEFRKRGYHATSMGDIADALGVTKGALYRYVKSKDEVLYECFMHSNFIGDEALKRVDALDGGPAQKLQWFLDEFIERYLSSNLAGGAMIEIDALLPEQRKLVVEGRDAIDHKLRDLLLQGIEDGTIIDESPKLIIFSFMGAINWIPSWYSADGEFTTTEIARRMARILMQGISSRPKTGSQSGDDTALKKIQRPI
jgi:TetR/AcrR family transcriptional regulator